MFKRLENYYNNMSLLSRALTNALLAAIVIGLMIGVTIGLYEILFMLFGGYAVVVLILLIVAFTISGMITALQYNAEKEGR